jgi:hypothetical protein
VVLPYKITPDHGRDLRDWIHAGHTFTDLLALAEAASPAQPTSAPSVSNVDQPTPIEADDDPHRLARVFVDQHATAQGDATLRFWKSSWWSWSGDSYGCLAEDSIKGLLTVTIKTEFDCINLAAQATARDGDPLPETKKVTRSVIGNVLGNTESILSLH